MLDTSALTRYIAAGSPYTPPIVLMRLATDNCVHIRRRVAENSNTPPEILLLLRHDDCPDVRIGLIDNASVSDDLLASLANDQCADVRYAMAENGNTPRFLLELLGRDENPYVAARAKNTLVRLFGSETAWLSHKFPDRINERHASRQAG